MLLLILCIFVPFLAAGAAAEWVHKRLRARGIAPAVVAAALAVASVGGYVVLLLATPFLGIATEAPLFVATALALVPPILVFMIRGPMRDKRNSETPDAGTIVAMFFTLALVAGVMVSWTSRVNFAVRLGWECDGPVVKKYPSSNHNAPTLEVRRADGGVEKLEYCDRGLWERAKVGDRLTKRRGSAAGLLNGQVVRVVERGMPWRFAPPEDVP
jgi:hypothetical protein